MSKWVNVTPDHPCQVCGAVKWCSRSEDGSALNCRHQQQSDRFGEGKPGQDANGNAFWTFRTSPTSTPSFSPSLSPNANKADADTLHAVYSTVLDELTIGHAATVSELSRRGLSTVRVLQFQQHGYRWLSKSGRYRIARVVLKKHGEQAVASTPGFVVRENKSTGDKYWTIAGTEGIVFPIRDASGRIVALKMRPATPLTGKYRWLSSRNRQKGDAGASPGTPVHVPLSTADRQVIRVTEGSLKADVTTSLSGVLTIGLPGLAWKKALPVLKELGASKILVAFDADWRTNSNVLKALENLVDQLTSNDFQVIMEVWNPEDGKGIDDILAAGKQIQQLDNIDEIHQLLKTTSVESEKSTPTESRKDGRTEIHVTPDEHITVDETLTALSADEDLYKRNGQLVHVVQEASDSDDQGITRSSGTPRILGISSGHLRERMTKRCFFFRTNGEGETAHCSPPASVVNAIHTRGFWPHIRNLSGVTEIPVLRPDGSILIAPGWDESTGLLFIPNSELPDLTENPTHTDAIAAKEMLLDVVADFPFASSAHQSAWLAGLLTILARRAFSGPAPMFMVDANIRGSGKSMLTDVISLIATSRPMPRLSNPESDEETRKRITALALAGDPLVLIDNIGGTLGSASLDAVLTSTSWKDRRLGGNDIVEMPMRAVWFATGNNIVLTGDMSRRICHIRLDSLEENPEERSDFRHPKLLAYVRENRLTLLAAGLTLLRAYVVAGRPDAGLKPWGSFEGWSDLIRNCVVWVGMDDPGSTRKELAEASDRDAGALRMLFDSWEDIDPKGEGLSAADMIQLLDFHKRRRDYIDGGMAISVAEKLIDEERHQTEAAKAALCELCGVAELTSKEVRKIGNQLKRFKGRVVGDRRLELRTHGRNKVNRWQVTRVDAVSAVSRGMFFSPSQNLQNEPGVNKENKNIKRCETDTAHPAHTASGICRGCGFDSETIGELCEDCQRLGRLQAAEKESCR